MKVINLETGEEFERKPKPLIYYSVAPYFKVIIREYMHKSFIKQIWREMIDCFWGGFNTRFMANPYNKRVFEDSSREAKSISYYLELRAELIQKRLDEIYVLLTRE